jgi:hypothetical protein
MLKGTDAREALSAVLLQLRKNLASSSEGAVDLQPYIALSEQLGGRGPLFRVIDELEGNRWASSQEMAKAKSTACYTTHPRGTLTDPVVTYRLTGGLSPRVHLPGKGSNGPAHAHRRC